MKTTELYVAADGRVTWRRRTPNGRIVSVSGEVFSAPRKAWRNVVVNGHETDRIVVAFPNKARLADRATANRLCAWLARNGVSYKAKAAK